MIDDGEDAERQCVTSQHAQTHSYQTPAARLSTLISLTPLSTSVSPTHTNPVWLNISTKKKKCGDKIYRKKREFALKKKPQCIHCNAVFTGLYLIHIITS